MMSRAEFEGYYKSTRWQETRLEALEYFGRKCAVCGNDYKKRGVPLNVHHVHYWYDGKHVFYREVISRDMALLCESHHPKGSFSKEKIAMWRSSYKWQRRTSFLFRLLWSVIRFAFRLIWLALRAVLRLPAMLWRSIRKRSKYRRDR
jgi:hypothetical protein